MADVKLIGIGGGGCNILDRFIEFGLKGADCIAMDFDWFHLETCKAPDKIRLESTWRGLDSPGEEYRKKDILMQKPVIKQVIGRADAVIVVAGLGGSSGSGGIHGIVDIAREEGIFTSLAIPTTSMDGAYAFKRNLIL